MVHFVGAGPGATDLITVRGQQHLKEADVIIYAGSLVNEELLNLKKESCIVFNSASMTLFEVIEVISKNIDKNIVRLHTGDPSIYGAIQEQIVELQKLKIDYDVTPGVSSFLGAASSFGFEYTLPSVSQSLILTRVEGRTEVPKLESIESFAVHQTSMVIFLSTSLLEHLTEQLIKGGYQKDTPAAIIYKATWKDEKKIITTIENLCMSAKTLDVKKTALILVGNFINGCVEHSKLYDENFSHEFRQASKIKGNA